MSTVGRSGRSFQRINTNDLRQLLAIAKRDRAEFFNAHPEWARLYGNRVLCVALCQGAALHYVDGTTGINDFDVYTFYKLNAKKRWPARRIKSYDLGDPKFGQSESNPEFVGRRVDCLGRAIDVLESDNAETALIRYLHDGATRTARLLAKKAVILLEPDMGKIVWTHESQAGQHREPKA